MERSKKKDKCACALIISFTNEYMCLCACSLLVAAPASIRFSARFAFNETFFPLCSSFPSDYLNNYYEWRVDCNTHTFRHSTISFSHLNDFVDYISGFMYAVRL